jgi:hypothetical protein
MHNRRARALPLKLWLTGCRKRMHQNSSVGWKPVQFVSCETTNAARFVAVTSRESLVGLPCFIPSDLLFIDTCQTATSVVAVRRKPSGKAPRDA